MNTKTTKFLAVLAVLAFAFAAFVVLTDTELEDATYGNPSVSARYDSTSMGPLDFSATTGMTYDGAAFDNVTLGNNIAVSYNSETKTYYITGTLAKQNLTITSSGFYKLWTANTEYAYGLAFLPYVSGTTFSGTMEGQTGTTGTIPSATTTAEPSMFFIKNKDTLKVTITISSVSTIYKIDLSGVTLAASAEANPEVAYVALENANALASVPKLTSSSPFTMKGTDGSNGTWEAKYTGSVSGQLDLILTNYNGHERFWYVDTAQLVVTLVGTNSIDVKTIGATGQNGPMSTQEYIGVGCTDSSNGVRSTTISAAGSTDASLSVKITITEDHKTSAKSTMPVRELIKLGDSSKGKTTLTVSSPYSGVYNGGSSIAIENAVLNASSGEKSINTPGLSLTGSEVNAYLLTTYSNAEGDNSVYGIRLKGTTLSLDANSVIITDGLAYNPSDTTGLTYSVFDVVNNTNIAGKVYVKEGAAESYSGASNTSGLYEKNSVTNGYSLVRVNEISSSDAKAKVYLVGDADIYAPGAVVTVTDISGKSTEVQVSENSSDNIQTALTTTYATVPEVIINVSGNINNLAITTAAEQSVVLRTGANVITGSITVKGTGTASNVVNVAGMQGNIGFGYGSIVMNIVDWDGGNVTIGDGDVLKLVGTSANIAGNVTIAGPTAEGTSASVIIDDAQSLNITGTLNVTGNVKINNDGALIGNGTVSIGENATFYTTKPVSVNFTGAGTIIIDDATQTVRLNGKYNSQNSYTPTQKVIIDGDLTIEDNAYIIINGGLEVLEGVTVNILNGGYLKVQSVTAYADIKGNIKSNSENGFVIDGSVTGDISISGNITASKASVDDKATVKILGNATLTGNLTVNTKAAAQFGQLSVESTGTLTVNGAISGTFYNAGLVTINGSVGTTTISASAADAVVDIVAIKSGTLTITDENMYLRTVDGVREKVAAASANVMTFTNVSGVNVTENIVFYTMDDVQYVYNATYLSGTATVADKKTEIAGNYPLITIDNGYGNYVISTFTITQAKVQINSPAYLTVTGLAYVENTDLTMTNLIPAAAETGLAVAADAKLTVTGILRSTTDEIELSTSINAVKFSKMEDTVLYIYYTNLSDAIASGVKDLEVLGKLTISKDTVIPAGYEIDASGKAVDIGSQKYPEVTLTIEDGGSLSAGTVTVYGTMYVEDVDTGLTASSIISDTSNVTDKDATYTNIYFALNTAKAGETVKITNKDGRVIISKNVTIPAGVTLSVPANEILGIQEGYTLTVAGYLLNRGTVSAYEYVPATKTYVVGEFAEEADSTHAAIAVTGTIESMTSMPYATYKIPGAYYTYKTMSFITSLPNSAAIINDAEGKVIDVYGSKMAYGTVTYAGTPTAPVTVRIHDTVASGTINLSYGTINLDAKDGYVLKIVGANGSINLADVKVTTASVITAAAIDGAEILKMTAGVFDADSNASVTATKKKMTFDGNVEVSGSTIYKATVPGTLLLSGNVTLSGATNVSGTLAVNNDAVVNTAADVTVTGTLAVYDATATKAAGDMNITGILYIGGSSDLYTTSKYAAAVASVASVSGDVSVTKQYIVFPGSTVAGKVSDYIDGIIEDKKYTAFYAEESLFVTVYAVADTAITSVAGAVGTSYFVPKSLEDCDFVLWQYLSSGELKDIKEAKNVGAYQAVYAKINYNLYSVTIVTDEGVKSVAIDGVEMISTGFNYFKTDNNGVGSKLVAGTHTVTYTLKNGYEGTAVLSTAMGTILKDNKFVVSGTEDADRAVTYQLTGTEQIIAPEPSPVEESEWTITTILLVILVILIAIMAVIVALRLNRS